MTISEKLKPKWSTSLWKDAQPTHNQENANQNHMRYPWTPINLVKIFKSYNTTVGRMWSKQNCQLKFKWRKLLWKQFDIIWSFWRCTHPVIQCYFWRWTLERLYTSSRNVDSSTICLSKVPETIQMSISNRKDKQILKQWKIIHQWKWNTTISNMF